MLSNRRRIVCFYNDVALIKNLRDEVGRNEYEILSASDLQTFTATLRLYKNVDVVVAEKIGNKSVAMEAMRSSRLSHANALRVLVVQPDAMDGVYDAIRDKVVDELLFKPLTPVKFSQLLETRPAPVAYVEKYKSVKRDKSTVGGVYIGGR